MDLTLLQAILAMLSGSAVGFALGLIGGGGSILAVPLLLYVVGLPNAHLAIGTSALAVAANAFINLAQHARNGTVKWPCASVFAVAGVLGALVGSTFGKAMDGDRLLVLFALVMIAVGVAMLLRRGDEGDPEVRITPAIGLRLAGIGFLVMTYLSSPPWPWLPPGPPSEGNPLFINKNLIEAFGLFVVLCHPTGRWLGLDALIDYLLFGRKKPKTGNG